MKPQWDDFSLILPFENIKIIFSNKRTGINNANSLIAFSKMVNFDSNKLISINQIHLFHNLKSNYTI